MRLNFVLMCLLVIGSVQTANAQFKAGVKNFAKVEHQANNKKSVDDDKEIKLYKSPLSITKPKGKALKIVAVVNGDIITSQDIQNRINLFLMTTKIPMNKQTQGLIVQKVMHAAVDEKIKLQEAKRQGIEISEKEVQNSINAFEKNNKMPKGGLAKVLKKAKVSEDTFKEQMKSDLAWVRLVRRGLANEGDITQKEIDEAFKDATKDMDQEKFLVSEIFIKKEKAKNLNDLVYNLRNDPRFGLYAMQFSDSPTAANGGNIGWINKGKLPTALENAIRKLKKGEVSDPIKMSDGYYILKVENVFTPNVDKPEIPTQAEIKNFLENQRMENYSRKYLQNLRQRAVIEMR